MVFYTFTKLVLSPIYYIIRHNYIFELHHNIIKKDSIIKLMKVFKNNKFQLKEKYFNSYYFEKK